MNFITAILDFIFDYKNNTSLLGKTIWVDLSKHFIGLANQERSWQSLKERFKKRIVPKLTKYRLKNLDKSIKMVEECASSFKNADDVTEMKNLVHKRFKKNAEH